MLEILDDKFQVYAINFNQKIDGKWCSIHEQCDFKPFCFFKSNFTFRIPWKVKAWGFENRLIQVYESTYDETNKNICIYFINDNYEAHESWYNKSVKLSKDNHFNLFIISKFANRLAEKYKDNNVRIFNSVNSLDLFEVDNSIYATYTIDRKEILTRTSNWWNSEQIFLNHSKAYKTWDHPRDWIGMNHNEIFNNIMGL
jgi:hypothetical protein